MVTSAPADVAGTYVPVIPPRILVTVSVELYVIVGSPEPSTPCTTDVAPEARKVKSPEL